MKTLPFINIFLLIIASANWSYASEEDGITIIFNNINIILCNGCTLEVIYKIIKHKICYISVQISDGNTTQSLGKSYNLTCRCRETTSTFHHWLKDGRVLNETKPTLSFRELKLSDAGQYTCVIMVNSTTFYNKSVNITLKSM